jgi:phytoene dehydrogenase-like protein
MTASPASALVVGGGPAGLATANHLLDAGLAVALLEARGALGGRAASDVVDGFTLNQGPHALYLGGSGRRELAALGIDPAGRIPTPLDPRLVRADGTSRSLLTASLGRLVARALRTRPQTVAGRSAAAWLGDDPVARAFGHVVSYTGPLERLSADALIVQLRSALHGVRYLDGGWQSLVDALTTRAWDRGASLRVGAAVRSLTRTAGRWVAVTDDAEHEADVVVVATGGPARAARLLGVELEPPGPPAEASILDLGLTRLPRPRRTFGAGLDEPRYASVHSGPKRITDRGVLLTIASYGRATRPELEAFADALQPGWRDEVLMTRHLPGMEVITALPTPERGGLAGRPGPQVPGAPGAFVAGDWVGPDGMLVDAALASARVAARAAVTAAAGAREPVPA